MGERGEGEGLQHAGVRMSMLSWWRACRHGFGHWDQVAGDVRLGLDAKLEAAAVEKHGRSYEAPDDVKHLPKGD